MAAGAAEDPTDTASAVKRKDDDEREGEPSTVPVQRQPSVDEFGLRMTTTRRQQQFDSSSTSDAEGKDMNGEDSENEDGTSFRTPPTEVAAAAKEESPELQVDPTPAEGLGIENGSSEETQAAESEVRTADPSTPVKQSKSEDTPSKSGPPLDTTVTPARRPQSMASPGSPEARKGAVSEWSHMQLAPKQDVEEEEQDGEGEWQTMPAFATHTIYDDWGKVLAREEAELEEQLGRYDNMGGAAKGYTKVQLDEDAQSATSLDDDTAYLFKQGKTTTLLEEDEEGRDMMEQMQATKDILTEGQRIAYVGIVRICTMDMYKEIESYERTKSTKKLREAALESMVKWSQKMMVRLYGHMDIEAAEQLMIEQLAEHGVQATDLTPPLMQNARVRNPMRDTEQTPAPESSESEPRTSAHLDVKSLKTDSAPTSPGLSPADPPAYDAPPEYRDPDDMSLKSPSAIADQKKIDIDVRWTVLCDLFLILVADSSYDARSRTLLERVGKSLSIEWLDICRFEKRITDALEMQEAADKENWNEDEHMDQREKSARNRKLIMMGLATVGGGLVIGLSAGLLAPVIGAGLAAGFTTLGVAGTGTFFGGVGAAALITSTGVITGGTIGVRASSRRMGAVKTFEYRPLHNNKRVNLVVTVAGWMTGKVDDVRLPFSTVDPVMGDIYSVLWEPEMLQSMGQTINILATEALTQGLQQILASTILTALMGALQLPIVLTKLSYLIDNPWNVSLARADQAGLILADSLMDRNLGSRPITLLGFSIGSRVIFSCLKELAKKGAYGLVQNVYIYGSPIVASKDDYLRVRTIIPGRFVNGYASNDWILGYLFRATAGGIGRVAGLAPINIAGYENVDVTADVNGHMAYRAAMPKLLERAGWSVDSLEFTEIEDPDPDNHVKRQRELINEIEEARKDLQSTPSKRGIRALFSRSKKNAEKKEWETYDDQTRAQEAATAAAAAADAADENASPVLFDVDAIAREVAELAAEGIEIRELESTLPPMRLAVRTADLEAAGRGSAEPVTAGSAARSHSTDATTAMPPTSAAPAGAEIERAPSAGSWWRRKEKSAAGTPERVPSPSVREEPARPALRSAQTDPQIERNAWAEEEEVEMTFE